MVMLIDKLLVVKHGRDSNLR